MARTAKPAAAGNNNGGKGGTTNEKGKGVLVPDNMGPTKAALQHNAYLTVEWTPEEQSVVEELLVKYASESKMYCYAQIARQLKDKYLRDVVLRCRWMSEKEKEKRGKGHISRKNEDKEEKVADSMPKLAYVANRTNGTPNAQAVMSTDTPYGMSYEEIGGPTGQLLEQNTLILDQINANFATLKIQENNDRLVQIQENDDRLVQIQENNDLLIQVLDNFRTLLNNFNDSSEIMALMPPLPVKIDEELANANLQRPPLFPNKS